MHAGRVRGPTKGVLCALGAALLFGLSTPLAKRLLPSADPWLLAGLLYLGSGLGLSIYRLATTIRRSPAAAETPLGRADLPWLTMAIFFGGIVGPVLLMLGLRITPASSASLLLNLEGVFTALLAWFAFRENFDARIAWGMALISAGALTLSWQGRPMVGPAWGSAAIAGACLCWALDNNLTRKVSASDPVQIALVKGWCAGAVNTALGLVVGAQVPTSGILLTAGLVGFVGYGVSLALFVVALRELGTARTGAYFSLAPFVGGAMAVILLGEPAGPGLLLGAGLMGCGVWLHLTEHHAHDHAHEAREHDHRHTHDEHHQHAHGPNDPHGEPHAHTHRHEPMIHSHPHYPDLHHRHRH